MNETAFASLEACFGDLPDPRVQGRCDHQLIDIIWKLSSKSVTFSKNSEHFRAGRTTMKYEAIDQGKTDFPVSRQCVVLGVSESGYYVPQSP